MVAGGGERVGIIRIPVFQPEGSPALCEGAVAALAIDPDRPCDDGCADRILTWAYRRMTGDFEERLRRLRTTGANVLMVDISGNGGGSEWAEAAARSVSPVPLTSERRAFVRGEHWARQWRDLAALLRERATSADPADRARLLGWAAEADAALRQAEPCPPGADCARLGHAGYTTGLVGAAPAGAFAGRGWAADIFSPAQYPYHDHVWTGPLIVLVDQETWSAAEEFAAVLQDNRAAIILGARTGGAGCGHTNGGTPTLLHNSGATLSLPDCARLRADGSNEVRGVIPDELVGLRADDGNRFRAGLVTTALGRAVARAKALHRRAD
jgi:C-terminal processing protease CtpA/Prc